MSQAVSTMARKPKKSDDAARREDIIAIRCFPEYKDWVRRFAKRTHHTPTQLFEMAIIDLAEKLGFEPPPER